MKAAKRIVLAIAFFALVLTMLPLVSHAGRIEILHDDPGPTPGGGGSGWSVQCQYDGSGILISRTCSSGGTSECYCP